ncbi:mannose-6-phosphate receptor binding domain-containing protein [Terfezia claveryi]|nr:mannose-6-phosphate receptor binding domain-containing protein [Terfezia claveryi]
MGPRGPFFALLTALLLLPTAFTSSFSPRSPEDDPPSSTTHPATGDPPCTITSPHTGSFFDLRPLIRTTPDSSLSQSELEWTTSGHDYNTTFHLNICGPVLSDVSKARGIDSEDARKNISAFYERDGDILSVGQASSTLLLRGKKLILEYTHGSPCSSAVPGFNKSAIISFLCDRELGSGKADVAYVGEASDCSYFFEIRTLHACATIQTPDGEEGLSPLAIFAVICLVFLAVYCVGGCVYQRTVMNARGWRQVPHYHTWARMATELGNCCGGLRRGAVRLPQNPRHGSGWGSWGTRSGRAGPVWARGIDEEGDVEDENRLLDQLEGEWED